MQFVFSPILGSLSDRIGRRPLLLVTIALSGLAYVLVGLTESLAVLFADHVVGPPLGGVVAEALGVPRPPCGACSPSMSC